MASNDRKTGFLLKKEHIDYYIELLLNSFCSPYTICKLNYMKSLEESMILLELRKVLFICFA